MSRFKVKIEDGAVIQSGKVIAHMGRGREVWVTGTDEKRSFIARFKYMRPGRKARAFLKTVFNRMTLEEYLALLATGVSPLDIEARCEGYASSVDRYRATKAVL
jgi:hypothetical protein